MTRHQRNFFLRLDCFLGGRAFGRKLHCLVRTTLFRSFAINSVYPFLVLNKISIVLEGLELMPVSVGVNLYSALSHSSSIALLDRAYTAETDASSLGDRSWRPITQQLFSVNCALEISVCY